MTELETQLMTALRRLSAQYETEQRQHAEERQRDSEELEALRQRVERQTADNEALRRHCERQAGQIEALQQRVEQLGGQVTYLAQDYRTLAETLRGLWT